MTVALAQRLGMRFVSEKVPLIPKTWMSGLGFWLQAGGCLNREVILSPGGHRPIPVGGHFMGDPSAKKELKMDELALAEALLIARVLLVTLSTLAASLALLGAFRRQDIRIQRTPAAPLDDDQGPLLYQGAQAGLGQQAPQREAEDTP